MSIESVCRAALIETISWTLLISAAVIYLASGWTAGLWVMVPVDTVIWTTFAVIVVMATRTFRWSWSFCITILAVSLVPIWGYFWIRDQARMQANPPVS